MKFATFSRNGSTSIGIIDTEREARCWTYARYRKSLQAKPFIQSRPSSGKYGLLSVSAVNKWDDMVLDDTEAM